MEQKPGSTKWENKGQREEHQESLVWRRNRNLSWHLKPPAGRGFVKGGVHSSLSSTASEFQGNPNP
jgi:hypothetical protein